MKQDVVWPTRSAGSRPWGGQSSSRLRTWIVATSASLIVLTAAAPVAHAYVYWANRGNASGTTVGRSNLDGTGVSLSFIGGATGPAGVAVDGAHIYWANTFGSATTIGRANLDGTGADQSFITGANSPCGVAVDGSYVYWADNGSGTIGRANLDGTGVNQSFITGATSPCGVAVDGSYVYWANEGGTTIGRANLNGTGVNNSFITGADGPVGVAVNGSYIYWGNNYTNTIGRANLNGSSVNNSFITGSGGCTDFPAVDATYIYWANDCSSSIGRANLDGTGVNEVFIAVSSNPGGVAVNQLAPLAVSLAGSGSGSVTGSGISCPNNCTGNYALGQQATLTATPSAGSVFTGWSGAGCSGTGGCTVTIGAEQTVTATFDPASPVQHVLTVSRSGSGSGTVTSAPPGIDCGATCSASFKNGSQVTLTATPAAGSTFAGWTVSGCSGTDACVVTMSSDQTITATFTPARSTAPPKCVGVVKSSSVLLSPTQSHGQRGSKQAAGTLALRVTCDQSATVNLSGKLIERGKQRSMTFSLRNRTASVSSGVAATLTVSLPPGAVAALRRGAYESVAVSLIVSNANGTSRLKTIISRPRLRH